MKTALLCALVFTIAAGCRDEFHQLTPGTDPPLVAGTKPTCQAPSIEKNILGTWQYVSTFNGDNSTTTGTITFDQKGNISDPDSLFENRLDLGPVVSKTYKPSVPFKSPNYEGEVFEVYLFTKEGKKQIIYFTIVSSECEKIHLSLLGSAGNKSGFILTR